MTSTDRKSAARAYMAEHGVNYTTALRALYPDRGPIIPLQYMLLRADSKEDTYPVSDGSVFDSLEEAKAAGGEMQDVITSGYFAPDETGGVSQWHNYPYGNWLSYNYSMWGDEPHWDPSPNRWEGWNPGWFARFPTPKSALQAPGQANGDLAYGHGVEGYRFVTTKGSLITRVLPLLGDEATLSRITDTARQKWHRAEMKRITTGLDQSLGISLREQETQFGPVQYWEFETPNLENHIGWSSVDRCQKNQVEALTEWTHDEYPYESSLNQPPYSAFGECKWCEGITTREHPLAPGSIVSLTPYYSESCSTIETPLSAKRDLMVWSDLLLLHALGTFELAGHDGCAQYWK